MTGLLVVIQRGRQWFDPWIPKLLLMECLNVQESAEKLYAVYPSVNQQTN